MSLRTLTNVIFAVVFVPLTIVLTAVVVLSLQWRMVYDSPYIMYFAFLMDRLHFVPYRDFYDINLPASYALDIAISKILGYTDIAIHGADVVFFGLIAALTWVWQKRFGRKVAITGIVLFGLDYFAYGPSQSFEREYTLIPFVVGAAFLCSKSDWSGIARGGLIGLFFGYCATIKPQAAIGFPVVLLFLLMDVQRQTGRLPFRGCKFWYIVVAAGVGFSIPVAATIGYLFITGSFQYFLDIARNFYPLYSQMTGNLVSSINSQDRITYTVLNLFSIGEQALWLIPTIVTIGVLRYRSNLNSPQRFQFWLLASLALCYWIMPVFEGKFFPYHWIIFLYFVLQLSAFCFMDDEPASTAARAPGKSVVNALLPRAAMILVIAVSPLVPLEFNDQIRGIPLPLPNDGLVDTFTNYLSKNMKPNDKVQAMDWMGGVPQAMLMTKAVPATRFTEDFWLYAYLSSPYIQSLRSQFITEFSATMPRFVLEVFGPDHFWVTGPDTGRDFPALQAILAANYDIVLKGDQYRIYQRRPSTTEAF